MSHPPDQSTRPAIIGLTGSIGMGKSTVAAMFADLGVPIFDADAVVRQLQGPGGPLLPMIEDAFPGTTGPDGVDRGALGEMVFGKPDELACDAIVLVTERHRVTRLFDELRQAGTHSLELATLELIGDAAAPGLIADAVYSGHMAARNFEKDKTEIESALFRREITALSGT